MIKPKLLLMDMDDVLVDHHHLLRCQLLAETAGVSTAYIEQAVFGSGLERRSDRGEFGLDEFMDKLRTDWGLDIPGEDFIMARRRSTQARPNTLTLCAALGSQVQLGIFSNNAHWLAQSAERVVPELMPLFRTRFVCSGSLGASKPEPEAFLLCLQRLGFSAAATLFVDDKLANVEGAKLAGLDAFVYVDDQQFKTELSQRGLIFGEINAP
jgi:glucose-1-phosphatase